MKSSPGVNDDWWLHPAVLFCLFFFALILLHESLLRLPYFWDEAGYYIPAARDVLLTHSLIPHSTPSNAHPPLVMIYLALCWKIAGFAPIVTRIAMLAVAAFALTGLFRLAASVANAEVAAASVICTSLYPVFFVQSSLAQVDLAAAGFTFWALLAYVKSQPFSIAVWFSLAVLTKETAMLGPLSLLAWELVRKKLPAHDSNDARRRALSLTVPIVPLALWYAYHRHETGFVFGNPEFFRYNVQQTLLPLRIVLAFFMRVWQVFGYLNLFVLTLFAIVAMSFEPLPEGGHAKFFTLFSAFSLRSLRLKALDRKGREEGPRAAQKNPERPRIAMPVQFAFLSLTATYAIALSIVGGAVLARYMLPAIPLVIIVCVSTLRRRIRMWWAVIAVVAFSFTTALFVNPPYGFSLEDNFAYRDYIQLHQRAERFVESQYPNASVLTAWPASDELSRTYLGFVAQPMKVFRVENFTVEELMSARQARSNYDVALVFSTKYEPPHSAFDRWATWQEWKARFFGYHRDVPPAVAAQMLGGKVVYEDQRDGQWIVAIKMESIVEAHAEARCSLERCD